MRRHGACATSATHFLLWEWVYCCFWASFYSNTLTGFTELHRAWKEQVLLFVLGEALPVTLGGFGSGPRWGVCFAAGLKVSVYLLAWQVLKGKTRSGAQTSILSCLPLWCQKQLQFYFNWNNVCGWNILIIISFLSFANCGIWRV